MITAMVDTTTLDSITWRYHADAPRCAEVSFNDSVFALLPPPLPAPGPPAPPTPVSPVVPPIAEHPPQARPHRNWGPVNNTPPKVPYVVENSCGGEGCATTGTWVACSTLTARESKEVRAAPVFTFHPGERFSALKSDMHVDVAGMVGFRHPMVHAPEPGGATIQFTLPLG